MLLGEQIHHFPVFQAIQVGNGQTGLDRTEGKQGSIPGTVYCPSSFFGAEAVAFSPS